MTWWCMEPLDSLDNSLLSSSTGEVMQYMLQSLLMMELHLKKKQHAGRLLSMGCLGRLQVEARGSFRPFSTEPAKLSQPTSPPLLL